MKICFTLRLLNRDYPLKFIKKNMNEICWIEKNHWMFPKNRDKTLTPITLKLEYNRIDPLRNQVMKCIHDNLNLLPNSTKDKIMITHSLKRKLQSFLAPSNIDKKRRKISENSRHSSNFEWFQIFSLLHIQFISRSLDRFQYLDHYQFQLKQNWKL